MDVSKGLIDSWRRSLHSNRPRTVALYLSVAENWLDWLREHDLELLDPGRREFEAWFNEQRERGLSPATLRSRWIALRNLYGWLTDEEELDVNPMAKVKVPKVVSQPIQMPTDADIKALFATCSDRKNFYDVRDLAILRTMAATGLRLSEVADLTLDDVDLDRRLLHVRDGKGGRGRFGRFDAATAEALDRWIRRHRAGHKNANLPNLWLGFRGPFGRKGIGEMVPRRAKQAGIDHVHPHALRHFFADHWLRSGGNEQDLLMLGGWENRDVMRRYGSARAADRALTAYDSVRPLGEL